MENKINPVEVVNDIAELRQIPESTAGKTVDVSQILARIDRIIDQGDSLMQMVENIRDLPVNDSPYGGSDGAARAEAIGNVYRLREETNQKMIAFLNKMYDDMIEKASESSANTITKMDWVGVLPDTAKVLLETLMGKNPNEVR